MFTSKTIMKKCLDCCCAKTVTYTVKRWPFLKETAILKNKYSKHKCNSLLLCMWNCTLTVDLGYYRNCWFDWMLHQSILYISWFLLNRFFFLFRPRHGCFQVVLRISVLKRWGFLKNTKSHSDKHDFGKENKTVPGIWVDDKRCVGVHRIVSQYEKVNACYPFQC